MTSALAELRRRIREIEGRPAVGRREVDVGHASLAEVLGGLPCPGLVEVCGPLGGGGTRLALTLAAGRMRAGEPVAWVDPHRTLYPPAAASLGVALEQLLLVRPEPLQASWAVEELLRCGCFGLVVTAEGDDLSTAHARWAQAARQGRTTLVVLSRRPARGVVVDLRLVVQGGEALVQRRRGGPAGARGAVPPWPPGMDPWDASGGVPWA